jgi:hypothetical protein
MGDWLVRCTKLTGHESPAFPCVRHRICVGNRGHSGTTEQPDRSAEEYALNHDIEFVEFAAASPTSASRATASAPGKTP